MFGNDKDELIKSLLDQLAASDESASNLAQEKLEAERRVATMIQMRDPAQMATLALSVAAEVEDQFARGFDGGHFAEGWVSPVQMRRNAIATVIRGTLERALLGAKREDI